MKTLFQIGSIASLISGVFESQRTIGGIQDKGNFGLGTFNGIDGNLVVIDNLFYNIDAKCKVSIADKTLKTPFCVLTDFETQASFSLDSVDSYDHLAAQIMDQFKSKNCIYAVKITGRFKHIKGRSDEKRPKPYKKFTQTVHELENLIELNDVSLKMAGVYFPDYLAKVNAPGFHFHFINGDATHGGHLYQCVGEKIKVELCLIDKLDFDLLTDVQEYHQVNMHECTDEDIKFVEGEVGK